MRRGAGRTSSKRRLTRLLLETDVDEAARLCRTTRAPRQHGGAWVVQVCGEIDLANELDFQYELAAALMSAAGQDVVIDVSRLGFASVACTHALAVTAADPSARVVAVVGVTPILRRVWQLFGHDLPVAPDGPLLGLRAS